MIGGNVVLLRNDKTDSILPLFWKSKTISKVCHSSKKAETENVLKLIDESLYQASMLEQVLFGDTRKVSVNLYRDSQSLLDSVSSTKQVGEKMLRPVISDMKDR